MKKYFVSFLIVQYYGFTEKWSVFILTYNYNKIQLNKNEINLLYTQKFETFGNLN